MIASTDPVRGAFEGHRGTFDSHLSAVQAYSRILRTYGYSFGEIDFNDLSGRRVIDIYDAWNDCVGSAVLTWFPSEEGVEIVGHII